MSQKSDLEKINAVRETVQLAENTGNLELMASVLSSDITIVIPKTPVLNTKEAGVAFLKSWFDGFLIEISYRSQSIEIRGDTAYEWATYNQKTIDKITHEIATEKGRILWIYKKQTEKWLQHFIIWNTL